MKRDMAEWLWAWISLLGWLRSGKRSFGGEMFVLLHEYATGDEIAVNVNLIVQMQRFTPVNSAPKYTSLTTVSAGEIRVKEDIASIKVLIGDELRRPKGAGA